MLVLALDTATPATTAGLVGLTAGTSRALAHRVHHDARAHGEVLVPLIHGVLAEAGTLLSAVDAIVCGAGPGPFTGLRVGLVTAAALGDALAVPVHAVGTLDAIAAEAPGAGPLLVATDARRREVYWARYDHGRRSAGPDVAHPVDVPTAGVARSAGAAAHLLGLPTGPPEHPSPVGLVAVAAAALRSGAAPGPLTPLYLRRPDAVAPGPAKRVSQ